MSFFKNLKEEHIKYSYIQFRQWEKEDNQFHIDCSINCRRISRFSNLKTRVFDRNMVDGLCYGKFYGIDKIRFKRYDYQKYKKSIFKNLFKKLQNKGQ